MRQRRALLLLLLLLLLRLLLLLLLLANSSSTWVLRVCSWERAPQCNGPSSSSCSSSRRSPRIVRKPNNQSTSSPWRPWLGDDAAKSSGAFPKLVEFAEPDRFVGRNAATRRQHDRARLRREQPAGASRGSHARATHHLRGSHARTAPPVPVRDMCVICALCVVAGTSTCRWTRSKTRSA
jgi:hypothetical protein